MSEGFRNLYYHQPFQLEDDHTINTTLGQQYSYTDTSSTFSSDHHQASEIYPFFNSFSEFLLQSSHDHQNSFSTSGAFGSSPPSTYEALKEDQKTAVPGSELAEATPNSSISSDSAEAVIGEDEHQDSYKGKKVSATDHDIDEQAMKETLEDSEETSKKAAKWKKKSEKKQKQPRFAFMTKSEVDHLEDGYRWRKYGQKAVKNSAYPRSYYRCTTQKCQVKKRVERSFQDSTIVITTYEGQHNHHIPTTFRGNMVAGIYPPSTLSHQPLSLVDGASPLLSFPTQIMPQLYSSYGGVGIASNNHQHMDNVSSQQFSGYGLLQDRMSPVFPKQEP